MPLRASTCLYLPLPASTCRHCFYWEVIELARKLLLTGFVFLIPQAFTLVRLVAAILLSLGYVVVLLHAAPYAQQSTAFVAVASNVTLLCTFLTALLLKVYDALPPAEVAGFLGITASAHAHAHVHMHDSTFHMKHAYAHST